METKNKDLKNGDFKKYYDTTQRRNYWVLGYFGGGPLKVMDAMRLANEYSDENNVPIGNVMIDEVLHSRRFKHFKFIYSDIIQIQGADAATCEDVYKMLTD